MTRNSARRPLAGPATIVVILGIVGVAIGLFGGVVMVHVLRTTASS